MVASRHFARKPSFTTAFLIAVSFVLLLSACKTTGTRTMTAENMVPTALTLSPGDSVEITFPGATNLTGIRRIGPEGSITLPNVGQVQAAGRTAAELEMELERLYEKELNDNDVIITVTGSANVIYVTGSVARTGRVQMDRPLTALEAILESGGFLPDANMKKVSVFRYEGDENVTYVLDLEPVFAGGPVSPFYLKPRDVVNVPKKIQWF